MALIYQGDGFGPDLQNPIQVGEFVTALKGHILQVIEIREEQNRVIVRGEDGHTSELHPKTINAKFQ